MEYIKLKSRTLLAGITIASFLFGSVAVAANKVVVIPLNSKTKTADATTPCNASNAGLTRWSGSAFEGCNGTAWIFLSVPTVYSSGHEWMDRNLGASRVAESSNDDQAYGDLYQWGRFRDGHEKRSSSTTAILSNGDVPGHGDFITASASPNDWRDGQNADLWQASGINNPCPAGFRLPTFTELNTERLSWDSNNSAGAYGSPLKLVVAGIRNRSTGNIVFNGSSGFCWSSTVSGSNSLILFFNSGNAFMGSGNRAFGYSVRCLKD